MEKHPSLREGLRQLRLTSLPAWRDRLIVWSAALAAGLAVVAFTTLCDLATEAFQHMRAFSVWTPFIVTPLATALVVWITRRLVPFAAGSGIPQVMTALHPSQRLDADISRFVSLRVAVAKVLLTTGALMAGLSLGREGPSVQVAASVMYGFRRIFGRLHGANAKDLILAGGAAGMAAAFNAPLAGIVFAIEELSRRFEQRSSGLLITAIVLAGLVSISIEGNFTYFGQLRVQSVSPSLLPAALIVVVSSGLLGGAFSRLLLLCATGRFGWPSRARDRHPVGFAAACGLMVGLLGYLSNGTAHGSGYTFAREMLEGAPNVPLVFVAVKFLATWLTYWSGVPGGIFSPCLAIGAGLGNDVAQLTHSPASVALIALGMAAFLAAVTQAPITTFIIVMEMVDGHGLVLSLMASALASSLIARLISPPLYPALCQNLLLSVGINEAPREPGQEPLAARGPPVGKAAAATDAAQTDPTD